MKFGWLTLALSPVPDKDAIRIAAADRSGLRRRGVGVQRCLVDRALFHRRKRL